jgi:pyridoxine 5-phosphate synthase
MPALLSVNINKYALLRNSRGAGVPDLSATVDVCIAAGAHGITVHPRRDERHVRFDDLPIIAAHLRARHPGIELNVECEDHPPILELVRRVRPDQCTLVPVRPGEVTSDHGWPMPDSVARLAPLIAGLRAEGIRVSCFADCDPAVPAHFAAAGADRIELYTGPYAQAWGTAAQAAETQRVWETARAARTAGIGLNAGHDLDRHNLAGIAAMPGLLEVSIGHAQICRALEVGTDRSVRELLAALGW